MCDACAVLNMSQGFKTDTGNTVVHTTNATVYKRRRRGERRQRVEAGGGAPRCDAHGGGRQLLLLERLERGALPQGDAVSGQRGAWPRSPVSAAVILRAALRRSAGGDCRRVGHCDDCSLCCVCVFLIIIYSQHKVIAGVLGMFFPSVVLKNICNTMFC